MHTCALRSVQRNKTDAADALGIAHLMRTGWFCQAHSKTQNCYRIRLLLKDRRNLKANFIDLENAIRHSLMAFGIRLGKVGSEPVLEAAGGDAMTLGLMQTMLPARAGLRTGYSSFTGLAAQHAMWCHDTSYIGDARLDGTTLTSGTRERCSD
ncbi:hypothetical protein MPLDJ20_330012 [Mesorhizobium plurifarium]|uniref:Transposase n=1 Tax=Mesorhizobium plurifarium TaxID=69974 RepID=A0A090GNW6_MESPL|nr:hypothetical protein MPLDJ20_330012 [Mesorhizobium plurifarium]